MRNFLISLFAIPIFIGGCASLELQSRSMLTNQISIDGQKAKECSVFLAVKDFSEQNLTVLSTEIQAKLSQRGYESVDAPEKAKYVLNANILFANNIAGLKEMRASKGAIVGGIVGGAVGLGGSNFNGNAGLAGLAIGGVAMALGAGLSENDIYRMVVDITVSENKTDANQTQKTRVFAEVSKNSLSATEALPVLVSKASNEIVNIFNKIK